MPIRFRCAYCNQLLGISRRKSGTVVRCPTCAGQVVVPNPEVEGTQHQSPMPAPASGDAGGPPIFERSDFDEVFNVPAAAKSAARPVQPATGPWGTQAEPDLDVERLEPVALPNPPAVPPAPPAPASVTLSSPGIVLSPAKATVLTVAAVLAVAVAFGLGLLVGRLL
jgi:phage FluMu protein Com